ncbi:Oidioi.mRNA.OKI2018_I69.chr1.g1783.t1.cds [Oikopleura dioica]|uniref:Oidioi.mRNA.OKI2018_I69.chr1.g1783.t1.cds n=1 Tax=Oikopleura dioica TaxID=34765 RepID=A0ABN7SNZ8_OIKDI|nr:Oidioi.mRNA.OKI2018_I69.chr1.g1783.t1.cds [Oikopleura dioica]
MCKNKESVAKAQAKFSKPPTGKSFPQTNTYFLTDTVVFGRMYKLAFVNRNLQLPYAHEKTIENDGNPSPEDFPIENDFEMLDILSLNSEMSLAEASNADIKIALWNPRKAEIDRVMAIEKRERRIRRQG